MTKTNSSAKQAQAKRKEQAQQAEPSEGDIAADQNYREKAREFVDSGRVEEATRNAALQSVSEREAAEQAGKMRARGHDESELRGFETDDNAFLSDVMSLRQRARAKVTEGAVTGGYAANREVVIELLNTALATELVCVLRYRRHHYMATGLAAQTAADEFLEHANEEQEHADRLARRITQLGGEPDLSSVGLQKRSHSEYVEGNTIDEMMLENLVAERIAIDSYSEMIRYIGDDDPTTRRMLEEILAVEEEHADDLAGLMA